MSTAPQPTHTHDLAIIGAGPAGMSAAITAQGGLRCVLLDEQPRAGGQIYRNVTVAPPTVAGLLGPDYQHGASLAQRFVDCGAEVHHGTLVWDVAQNLTVMAQQSGRSFTLRVPQLLVASGAMERPSPMPGWTLPGVLNAGAAQIAMKTSAQVPSGVVLVGGGPLLLVASQLLQAGAQVAAIVDTSPAANRRRALPHLAGALIDCADETIVCRCEEVTAGQVRAMVRLGCEGPNQTKFYSRCGMGPCQGHMCGITVTQLMAQALQRTPAEVGAYRIYLRDIAADFAGRNAMWEAWLADRQAIAPARTTVQAALATASLRVEMSVVAAVNRPGLEEALFSERIEP